MQKVSSALQKGDVLRVTCDHPPVATTIIPQFAKDNGIGCEEMKTSPDLREIQLTKT